MKNFILTALICVMTFLTTNTSAQIYTDSNGRVGIGTTSPTKKLDIEGGSLRVRYSNTSPYTRYPLDINTTAADPRIESERYIVFYNTPRAGFIDIYAKTLFERSDANDKENIQKMGEGYLNKVLSLDAVKYNWKSDDSKRKEVGFLAQDVEKIFPEVVRGAEGIEGKSIAYSHMVPLLVEALKEQQKMIEQQNELLQFLSKKVEGLEETNNNPIKTKKTGILKMYPNPTKGNTSLDVFIETNTANAEIKLTDMRGKTIITNPILKRGLVTVNMELDLLEKGSYIYTLLIDGQKLDSKILIINE